MPSWAHEALSTTSGQKVAWGELTRRQARNDPNAFVSLAFTDSHGRPLRQSVVHRDLQAFLSDHPKALVELPRDHGKSTQVCARVVWELARNPSLRVKIVCASDAVAAERGRFIRQTIEASEWVKLVFPNLTPDRPWTDTRLTIARPGTVIGPSVTAMGIWASSTGTRADLLVCDDIVDVKSLGSHGRRDRVKDFFRNNLMNLLEPDGRFWGLCTPWHRDDLNAELKRNPRYELFRRAVGDDLEPVWPERWPREALAARRDEVGVEPFARGYRLIPMADEETVIRPEWVRFWTTPVESQRVILSVDPAVSTKHSADASALVVLAKCGDEVRVLEAIARRLAAPALVALIEDVDSVWDPELILFEANSGFDGMAQMIAHAAPFGRKLHKVIQKQDKGTRASAFSVPVSSGRVLLQGATEGGVHPGQQALFDEMTQFPIAPHDDLLDAAAMGTAFLIGKPEPRVFGL